MTSLYGQYVAERMGDFIIEDEDGFATYRYLLGADAPAVYIVDIYVEPKARKKHKATELANRIVNEARNKGAQVVLGTVFVNAKNVTDSIKVLLSYGMTFKNVQGDMLIFEKDIL
jgi:N-acetylglutamate synthase-like GNAT family acetyltransferase